MGYLESQIQEFSQRIGQRLAELLPTATWERLDRIPGVNRITIDNILAEIGVDMTVFPEATLCDLHSRRLMRPDEVPRLNQLVDDLVDLQFANRAVPENLFDRCGSFACKIPNLLGH